VILLDPEKVEVSDLLSLMRDILARLGDLEMQLIDVADQGDVRSILRRLDGIENQLADLADEQAGDDTGRTTP
jgi:hypothetical protein